VVGASRALIWRPHPSREQRRDRSASLVRRPHARPISTGMFARACAPAFFLMTKAVPARDGWRASLASWSTWASQLGQNWRRPSSFIIAPRKSAIIGLTKSLARGGSGALGVRVNAVAPWGRSTPPLVRALSADWRKTKGRGICRSGDLASPRRVRRRGSHFSARTKRACSSARPSGRIPEDVML